MDPPKMFPYEQGSIPVQQMEQTLIKCDQVLANLKMNLTKAREEMKKQTDKHCRDVQYKVGGFVYVNMQPGRQLSLIKKENHKLSYKYYGPYEIGQRIGGDPRKVNWLKLYHGLQHVY